MDEKWYSFLLRMTDDRLWCANCRFFYQHYLKDGRPLEWGHCVYPKVKARRTCDHCGHFQSKKGPAR